MSKYHVVYVDDLCEVGRWLAARPYEAAWPILFVDYEERPIAALDCARDEWTLATTADEARRLAQSTYLHGHAFRVLAHFAE